MPVSCAPSATVTFAAYVPLFLVVVCMLVLMPELYDFVPVHALKLEVSKLSVKRAVGVGVGLVVGCGVGVGVAVGEAVGFGVAVEVGAGLAVGVGATVGAGVGLAVGLGVGEGVGLGVAVGAGFAAPAVDESCMLLI
jgi:hypothetical protein